MTSTITKKNEKRLERAKREYLEALKVYERDEEMRLAMIHQPKVNLQNIMYYSAYMQGARMAIVRFGEMYMPESKSEEAVYSRAVFKLITSDIRYTALFLSGDHDIRYRNYKRDKRGKLESVEAYFAEPKVVYKEVEV